MSVMQTLLGKSLGQHALNPVASALPRLMAAPPPNRAPMLFSAGQQGTVTMMISSLLIMVPQPPQLRKLPEWVRVPFVLPPTQNSSLEQAKFPCPFQGTDYKRSAKDSGPAPGRAACLAGDEE